VHIPVARGNEECEFSERLEAPAGGGGTTPSGISTKPWHRCAMLSRVRRRLTTRYENHRFKCVHKP